MKVSGSFTAGGGADRCFWVRPGRWRGARSDFGWEPLSAAAFPAAASFLTLAFFCGAAFLAAACFLAAPRDFWGSGGCSASSTASSIALENAGSTLPRPGGGAVGVMGHEVSTGGAVCFARLLGLRRLLRRLLGRPGQLGRLGRRGLGILPRLGLGRGGPALGSPDGQPRREDPPDAGHGLAPDQTTVVEQPGVLPVEFLEGVVGEDDGPGPLGDAQHEGVAAADGARRRGDHLAVEHGLAYLFALGVRDAVLEGRVDDHDDAGARVLGGVRAHGLVELLEAGERSSFGGQVRPVHHDVVRFSQWHVARDRPAPVGAGRRSRWRGWPTRAG